jgi:phosphoribosylformylglycinamidine synthase
MLFRVLVSQKNNLQNSLPLHLQKELRLLGLSPIAGQQAITRQQVYFLQADLNANQIEYLAQKLLCDPITEQFLFNQLPDPALSLNADEWVVEVGFHAGVTDNTANQLLRAAGQINCPLTWCATAQRYTFRGYTAQQAQTVCEKLLCNPIIQHWAWNQLPIQPYHPTDTPSTSEIVPIRNLDADALLAVSAQRRLSLDLAEMQAIQSYFLAHGREPSTAELETLAQTWSEHCVHKTFKALVQTSDGAMIDGLLKTYLRAATETINAPWVLSAFVDNAGVIDFTETHELSFKVETHNHPSAVEPFGGANTGVGGVIRDILGVSHIPIACTDVLCFAPQNTASDELPAGVLHPQQIAQGVIAGIEDYGNKMGLPTVNGAIYYDAGYLANPLVFCGSVGLAPKSARNGHRNAQVGDRIISIGGRTGRDGLRGATFSSMEMTADTGTVAGASVQIGDPITEKGTLEVIRIASTALQGAPIYHAITDCGAGGYSSAVGEMAAELGAVVTLETIRTKYPGLAAWELWLSEAQERLVLAVAPYQVGQLQKICNQYDVELTDLGYFSGDGILKVQYKQQPIVELSCNFLHNGIPRRTLPATRPPAPTPQETLPPVSPTELREWCLALLRHPNIASKESVVRVYDHEVGGGTVLKPLVGVVQDGPSDAAVLAPLLPTDWRGFALSAGLNPQIGKVSPYRMALSAIDEAVRNAVAVGADPTRIAILDNFCWGNPRNPERLGTLLATCEGCYTAALHYGTPFISGKDSLNNEYLDNQGNRHAIPDTLLISAIGIVPDVRKSVSMDLKTPGNPLFLLGDTLPEFGGSHLAWLSANPDLQNAPAPDLPVSAPAVYRQLHQAMQNGWVAACHDLSEGGLAVTAAEMCIAARLGMQLQLEHVHPEAVVALFAESNGRLLVEVPAEYAPQFATSFANAGSLPCVQIGQVLAEPLLRTHWFEIPLSELLAAWKTPA